MAAILNLKMTDEGVLKSTYFNQVEKYGIIMSDNKDSKMYSLPI